MKLNMHILYDELRSFSSRAVLRDEITFTLVGVRFFPQVFASVFPQYVYICTPEQLLAASSGRMDSELNFICIGEVTLSERKWQGIYLSGNSRPDEVLDIVQDIFETYNEWDAKLAEAAMVKNNFQRLLDIAAKHLWNPIALTDLSWYDLARSGQFVNDASTWGSLHTGYAALERSSDRDLAVIDKLLHSNRMPFFAPISLVDAQYLQAPIYSGQVLCGLLKTNDMNQPITNGQYSLIRHLQIWVERAVELTPIPIPMSGEDVAFADRLLEDIPIAPSAVEEHLALRGWHIHDEYRLLLCSLDSGADIGNQRRFSYCTQIRAMCPDCIIFVHEPYIVFIVHGSADCALPFSAPLGGFLSQVSMHAGISAPFNDYTKLPHAITQAKTALTLRGREQRASMIDIRDCFSDFLMEIIDRSSGLDTVCHARLLEYALSGGQRELDHVRSLQEYLIRGRNTSAAAHALFIHRNTLRNHLDHIQSATGIDMDNIPDEDVVWLLVTCLAVSYIARKKGQNGGVSLASS